MSYILQSFRRSGFIGPRVEVRLCDKGYALRGMDSFYFGLFSTLRAVWLCFFALRGCLIKFWNEGMLPCFDPAHWPDFGTGFRLGNKGTFVTPQLG